MRATKLWSRPTYFGKKPLPMETPVVLELEPANHVQVTLFNANHCTGAVMFCKFWQGIPLLIFLGRV